jgi:hypothetical protein
MFLLNDKPLALDTPFEHNGTSYPSNWLRLTTLAEKIAIGITEVADPAPYDDRFYWSVGNPKQLEDREEVDPDGNPMFVMELGEVNGQPAMVPTTKRLVTKGLKSQMVAQVKATAGSILAQTDWYVTRKFERGVEIPAKVAEKRAAVVAESERLEAAILACDNVPALISVMNAQNWGE